MKRIYSLLSIVAIFALIFTACSKDDEADPTFEISQLIGVWEMTGGDDFVACPDGDNKLITIDETHFQEGQTDDDGCDNNGYASFEYDFINGNTFDVGLGLYKVTSLSGSKMTIQVTSPLVPGVAINWTLEKQ